MIHPPPILYRCTLPSTLAHGRHAGETQTIVLFFRPDQLRHAVESLGRLLAFAEQEAPPQEGPTP